MLWKLRGETPVSMNLGKSLFLPVHQLPLLSTREINEMTSEVFYAFPVPPSSCIIFTLPPSAMRRGTQPHSLGRWLSFMTCLSFAHCPMSTPYLEHKWSPAVFGIIGGKPVSTIINSTLCKVVPDWIILTSCLNGRRDYLQMEANPLQGDCCTFSQ